VDPKKGINADRARKRLRGKSECRSWSRTLSANLLCLQSRHAGRKTLRLRAASGKYARSRRSMLSSLYRTPDLTPKSSVAN
jgi:hypothetical protein